MPLRLSTIALDGAGLSLLAHLPANPLAYIRGGDGLVGWGEAVRLEAHGANRIQDLSAQWQAFAAAAEVDDQVKLPGSGLVAFGSIAFADSSETSSALIVPKVLLGLRDGTQRPPNACNRGLHRGSCDGATRVSPCDGYR